MSKIDELKSLIEDFGDEHGIDNEPAEKDIVAEVAEQKGVDLAPVKEGQLVEMEHEESLKQLFELAKTDISVEDFITIGSTYISADHIEELGAQYYPELKVMEDKLKQENNID